MVPGPISSAGWKKWCQAPFLSRVGSVPFEAMMIVEVGSDVLAPWDAGWLYPAVVVMIDGAEAVVAYWKATRRASPSRSSSRSDTPRATRCSRTGRTPTITSTARSRSASVAPFKSDCVTATPCGRPGRSAVCAKPKKTRASSRAQFAQSTFPNHDLVEFASDRSRAYVNVRAEPRGLT